MVVRYAADGVEAAQVVLVGIVVAMPCHNVEGSVVLFRGIETASKLAEQSVLIACVFIEVCCGCLKVSGVRETVATNGTEFRKLKVALVKFEDIASD